MPISNNYAKHLKAGHRMAQLYSLQPLPQRNPRRPAMKAALTEMWQRAADAAAFIKLAAQQGYTIAKGYEKPFLVVDHTGQSFNLVRHISGAKTREVRERLKGTALVTEREAVASVRKKLAITENKESMKDLSESQAFLGTLQQARSKQQAQKSKLKL